MIQHFLFSFISLILLATACTETNSDTSQSEYNTNKTLDVEDTTGLAKATFAGGCFWCTEAYFERIEGVKSVISGYSGGSKLNPTYEEVSAGLTNYAEAVQVYYDPELITYEELVEIFFATHDPTTLNRQGPDIGEQYRSVAFYRSPEEEKIIKSYIKELETSGVYKNNIVTYIQPFKKFWIAEEYHQDYYRRNPGDPYVKAVAYPKVKKLEANYHNKLKPAFR